MYGDYWPDFHPNSLKRKNGGAVSNVSVRNAGLDRQYRHGVAIGLNTMQRVLVGLRATSSFFADAFA